MESMFLVELRENSQGNGNRRILRQIGKIQRRVICLYRLSDKEPHTFHHTIKHSVHS
jgi:hypothetical protein